MGGELGGLGRLSLGWRGGCAIPGGWVCHLYGFLSRRLRKDSGGSRLRGVRYRRLPLHCFHRRPSPTVGKPDSGFSAPCLPSQLPWPWRAILQLRDALPSYPRLGLENDGRFGCRVCLWRGWGCGLRRRARGRGGGAGRPLRGWCRRDGWQVGRRILEETWLWGRKCWTLDLRE